MGYKALCSGFLPTLSDAGLLGVDDCALGQYDRVRQHDDCTAVLCHPPLGAPRLPRIHQPAPHPLPLLLLPLLLLPLLLLPLLLHLSLKPLILTASARRSHGYGVIIPKA